MSELNIPESWGETELVRVSDINMGQSPSGDSVSNNPSGIPLLGGAANMKNGEIVVDRYTKTATKICDAGDIIYCIRATIGKMVVADKEYCLGRGVAGFRPKINPIFFRYYLQKSEKEIQEKATGSTFVQIDKSTIESTIVPVPPSDEQERIVQKIESCFSKIEETEQNLNKVEILLEKYRESLLAKAFRGELIPQNPDDEPASVLLAKIREERSQNQKGKKKEQEFVPIADDEKPFDIPESWIATKLYYAGEWGSGGTPLKSKSEFYGGEINWMKTGDLTNGFVTNVPDKITKQGLEDIGNKIYPVGTVVMAMYGATIGKLGLLKVETSVNQACACCTTSSYVDNRFLFYWLMAFRKEYVALGQGGAQPNISRAVIYDQFFAIPPLTEQVKIVHKLEDCFNKISLIKNKVNQKIKVLLHMRNSLLQKAFEGRLVDQIESEGTGHELLKKIISEKQKDESSKIKKIVRKKSR